MVKCCTSRTWEHTVRWEDKELEQTKLKALPSSSSSSCSVDERLSGDLLCHRRLQNQNVSKFFQNKFCEEEFTVSTIDNATHVLLNIYQSVLVSKGFETLSCTRIEAKEKDYDNSWGWIRSQDKCISCLIDAALVLTTTPRNSKPGGCGNVNGEKGDMWVNSPFYLMLIRTQVEHIIWLTAIGLTTRSICSPALNQMYLTYYQHEQDYNHV